MSARLAAPIEHAFVFPDGYEELLAKSAKSHAVILRGPAGSGKQGTAIRMLMDLGTSHFPAGQRS